MERRIKFWEPEILGIENQIAERAKFLEDLRNTLNKSTQ
jgi:hypothetical protein